MSRRRRRRRNGHYLCFSVKKENGESGEALLGKKRAESKTEFHGHFHIPHPNRST